MASKFALSIIGVLAIVAATASFRHVFKKTEVIKPLIISQNKDSIEIESPLTRSPIESTSPHRFSFSWKWLSGRESQPEEKYVLEFSEDQNFSKLWAVKTVLGKMDTTLLANNSLQLYFRIRGPQNQFSSVEKLEFNRIEPQAHRPIEWKAISRPVFTSEKSEEAHPIALLDPPRIIGEPEYLDARDGVGQVRVEFSAVPGADSYDIELTNDPLFTMILTLQTRETQLKTGVPTQETTFWRVRALDKAGHPITPFSESGVVMHDTSIPAYLTGSDRRPTGERSVMNPEDLVDDSYSRSSFSAWLGSGMTFTDYKQSLSGHGDIDYSSFVGGSKYFESSYSKRGIGAIASFKETPGKILAGRAPVYREREQWQQYSLEAQMRKRTPVILFGRPVIIGFRAGVQHHEDPIVFLNAGELEQKTMKTDNASAGGLIQWSRGGWHHYWLLRYQFPLRSSADGSTEFKVNPKFNFDGSIGISHDISSQLKIGGFWFGQWQQMRTTYSDGNRSNMGSQSVLNSTFDLRLGFQY